MEDTSPAPGPKTATAVSPTAENSAHVDQYDVNRSSRIKAQEEKVVCDCVSVRLSVCLSLCVFVFVLSVYERACFHGPLPDRGSETSPYI